MRMLFNLPDPFLPLVSSRQDEVGASNCEGSSSLTCDGSFVTVDTVSSDGMGHPSWFLVGGMPLARLGGSPTTPISVEVDTFLRGIFLPESNAVLADF